MARYLSKDFQYQDRVYRFECNIDQIAALRDDLAINITATSFSIINQQAEAITVVLTLDLSEREIVIGVEGEEVGRIPLDAGKLAEADQEDGEDAQDSARDAWDVFIDNLHGNDAPAATFEAIMERIPVADPFLGCLLKGAISASVGQTIRCYQQLTPREESNRQKLRSIARCLGENVWGIFSRAAARSVRCMLAGGFG